MSVRILPAYGFRWFLRQPGLAWAGVALLVLGIGANTTIFTVVDHLFFAPPPEVQHPERMVRLNRTSEQLQAGWWSFPDYRFFREHAEAFSGLAAYFPASEVVTATAGDRRVSGEVSFVSDNYFEVLQVRPVVGRGLQAGSGPRPQTEVVISTTLWERLFSSTSDVVGQGLMLNGRHFVVVGVAPRAFKGVSPVESPPDAWVPLTARPFLVHGSEAGWLDRTAGEVTWLQLLGRLAPGVSVSQARADLDLVSGNLEASLGEGSRPKQGASIQTSFRYGAHELDELLKLSRLLMAVVAAVLLIAGANVAILLLARAASKRRDYGVRMAMGASRRHVVGQMLVDSLVLALPGAVGGYLLAYWASDLVAGSLPLPVVGPVRPDLRVLGFTIAVALLVALVFGGLPALRSARSDILSQLKEGRPDSGRSRLREALVVVQVALSFLLVVGALLFVRSLLEVRSEDLGFAQENRLLVTVELGQQGYEGERVTSFVERALERIEGLAGVKRVSSTTMIPFGGMWSTNVTADDDREVAASLDAVGPGYFEVMAIPVLSGRAFTSADRSGARPVVVANQAAAKRLWPDGGGVGETVDLGDGERRTVVGIARDANYHEIGEEPVPHLYLPELQAARDSVTFVVETALDPASLASPVEEAIQALDPNLSFPRVEPLESVVDALASRYRIGATMVSLFGSLALILATIGLYAVLSYMVVQRRRVIGIQMALGASQRRVATQVVGRGLALAAIGIGLGTVGAIAGVQLITSFLYGVSPRQPGGLALVAALLLVVTGLASYVPAWRASKVDPIRVLRQE